MASLYESATRRKIMPIFGWVIFGIIGAGALFFLSFAVRALNGWVYKIDDMLVLLIEIRDELRKNRTIPRP